MSSTPPPPPGSGGDIPQPASPTGVPTPPPPPAAAVPPPPPTGMPAPPMATPGAPPMFQPSVAMQGRQYAGWWRRVLATFIDGLVGCLFLIPAIVALVAGPTEIEFRDGSQGPGFYEVPTNGTIGIAALLFLAGFLAYLVVYVRMLGKGASLGRKAAGYQVLDARTMEPIGTARAVGHFFARYLSALPFYLGFLWPLWDDENRTFHDMIVGTRAIVA